VGRSALEITHQKKKKGNRLILTFKLSFFFGLSRLNFDVQILLSGASRGETLELTNASANTGAAILRVCV
jgi:hypothetical protein